ncbi:hypothetical protein [Nocardia sp. CNY236]|uniref:hypothetical protein n=1 Tax=Nocardia sp. CNY236 TaxID=1169152 RepID=UPI0003FD3EC7|nr:hypothetical protein [Nocardia sp. CNY236]
MGNEAFRALPVTNYPQVLTRLASALRHMPIDYGRSTPDEPVRWLLREDGTWSPVFADGLVGPEFSWAQMLAVSGEDIGGVLEALIEAGLIGSDDRSRSPSTDTTTLGGRP